MFKANSPRRRNASTLTLSNAIKSQVEVLEGRVLLSATHSAAGADFAHAYNVGVLSPLTANLQGTVGILGNTDDFYKFTVAATSKVTLNLGGLSDTAAVQLDDASQNQLLYSSSVGSAPDSMTKYLDPGTYYVDVQGYSASSANYTLGLNATPALESGHTPFTANNLGNIGNTSPTLTGTLSAAALDQYWRFTTSAGTFSALTSGVVPNQGNIELLNSSGAVVSPLIDPNNPPDPNVLQYPPTPLPAGTYTLHLGNTTAQTLPFSVAVAAGAAAPSKLGGADVTTARNLGNLGSTQTYHSIVRLTDPFDFYKFTLTSPQTVNVNLSGLAANASVGIEDANQVTLQQTTYTGSSTQAMSVPLAAGTYYCDVALGGNVYTPFTLSLGASSVPTDNAGNSAASARELGLINGTTKNVTDFFANANGQDYYRFEVGASSTLSLSESALNNATLTLLGSDGSTVIDSRTAAGATSASLGDTVAPGTYYALVSYNGGAAAYSLSLNAAALPTDNAGNSAAGALNLGAIGGSTRTVSDYFANANGQDYYLFTVGANSTLTLGESALNGATLSLVASDGSTIVDSRTAGGTASIGLSDVVTPGTYYAHVSYSGAGSYYTLSLNAAALPTDGAGNSAASAQNLGAINASTRTVSDYFANANGQDYYKFTVASKSTLNISESALNGATLSLLGGDGATGIDSRTAAGPAVVSLSDTVQPGTYFARVSYAGAGSYYTLSLNAAPIVAPPADSAGSTAATALNLGSIGATTRSVGDYFANANGQDYYVFTVAAKSTLNISESALNGATLSLLGANGTTVLDHKTAPGATPLALTDSVGPGTYYALVNYSGTGANYSISLNATPAVNNNPPDYAGNTPAAARVLPKLINNQFSYFDDFVGNVDTNDYYKFTLATTTKMTEWASRMVSGPIKLTLTDVNGRVLDTSYPVQGYNASGTMLDALPAGTYYLDVTPLTGANTNYRIWFLARPYVDIAGNTPSAAYVVSKPLGSATQTFADMVGRIDTLDYYKFTLTTARTVKMSLFGNGGLTLYDHTGSAVLVTSNGTWSNSARISKALAAGTYFARVSYTTMDSIYWLSMSA